jgi:phosphoribosylformylglycinamidine synthase
VQPGFRGPGALVALLGTTQDDLSISAYAASIEGRTTAEMIRDGRVPALDLRRERSVQAACLRAAEAGLLHSAHDCSDGGLAVALAESCFSSLNRRAVGVRVELGDELAARIELFSESPSRIVVSFEEAMLGEVQAIAAGAGCPLTLLGRTVAEDRLRIEAGGREVVNLPLGELETAWRTSLSARLQGKAPAAAAE